MNKENYEKLKQVIQQANPEIMDLKFGCFVEIKTGGSGNYRKYKAIVFTEVSVEVFKAEDLETGGTWTLWERDTGKGFKILGRPIRLADVLLAVQKSTKVAGDWSVTATGAFEEWEPRDVYSPNINFELKHYTGAGFWDFSNDNLDNQSEETKEFLIKLLVK